MIDLNRKQKIKKIEKLLREGEKRQKRKNEIINGIIKGRTPVTPEKAAELIENTMLELNAIMRIAFLASSLKDVSIKVIQNWRISDFNYSHSAP